MDESSVLHIPGRAPTGLKHAELRFDVCGSRAVFSAGCRKEGKVQKNTTLSQVFMRTGVCLLWIFFFQSWWGFRDRNHTEVGGREGPRNKMGNRRCNASCSLSSYRAVHSIDQAERQTPLDASSSRLLLGSSAGPAGCDSPC